MIMGKVCSWSTLQCGQVKSEYRSMRNGAAGLPTLLLSGPAARQGSIRVSARADIFILLCYTKQLDAPPAGPLLSGFGGCARRKAGTATNSRLWNWLAVPALSQGFPYTDS